MNTKLIGIRDFRQNIAEYAKKASKSKTRYIITNRNIPLFEIRPFKKEKALKFYEEILEALEDVEAGKVYSHEEMLKKFSLDDKKNIS